MSTTLPPQPRQQMHYRYTFAIVASEYNPIYVQGLVNHTTLEIYAIAENSQILLYQAPGSFEIPVVAQELAIKGNVDAIIALGVIIQGETGHAESILSSITNSLQLIALKYRIPIIHEVLLVRGEEQARRRCLEPELNRGIEAARTAIQIANLMTELKEKKK